MSIQKTLKIALATSALAAVSAAPSLAGPASNAKDSEQITLTGTIQKVEADQFTLDYGRGTMLIEIDDWDSFDETTSLRAGDRVTVFGQVDADLFEERKVEAAMVYAHDFNAYLFANPGDEETNYRLHTSPLQFEDGARVGAHGRVSALDVNGDEFVLDIANYKIQVDTSSMENDPLDGEGRLQLAKGYDVFVIGELDDGFFERREIIAQSVARVVDMAIAEGQMAGGTVIER